MIVQLSQGITLRSNRRWWQTSPRWTAWVFNADHSRWDRLYGPLRADDMVEALISGNFPQGDLAVFLASLNTGRYVHNKHAHRVLAVEHSKTQPGPAGGPTRLPQGLFVEAG